MKWEMSYQPVGNILLLRTEGVLDKDSLLTMVKEASVLMSKHKCSRCLVDHSNITAVTIGTFDIYNMPNVYSEIGLPRTMKVAMVVPGMFRDTFGFLETVAFNVGYSVSVFYDTESASNWLKQ